MSKINPTDPVFPVVEDASTCSIIEGIPIKLELAARLMAAIIASGNAGNTWEEDCENALCAADTLINEYNKQEEQK